MNVGADNSMQRRILGLAVLAACVGGLGGCADMDRAAVLHPPPVNPESPVAAEAQAAVDRDYPYPRFRDIPAKPDDLPAPAEIKSQVADLSQTGQGQARWVAANPPMSENVEGWAQQATAQLPAFVHEQLPADQAARSEGYAAQLRAQAAAPPPIGGGAAPIAAPAVPAYLPAPSHPIDPGPPAATAKAKRKAKKKFKLPPPPASAPGRRPG